MAGEGYFNAGEDDERPRRGDEKWQERAKERRWRLYYDTRKWAVWEMSASLRPTNHHGSLCRQVSPPSLDTFYSPFAKDSRACQTCSTQFVSVMRRMFESYDKLPGNGGSDRGDR